ncbi:hypothetical protein TNCV_76801 [Trichonephila clavipes]|nr:hypothetical protein TNCV_76801 [Trichonephila clavipes]
MILIWTMKQNYEIIVLSSVLDKNLIPRILLGEINYGGGSVLAWGCKSASDLVSRRHTPDANGSDGPHSFSRQLAAEWSTATRFIVCFINSEKSVALWAARKDSFIQDSSHAKNHRHLRLHWANVHRSWRVDWAAGCLLTNPASICGTMMAEFESGSMPVNGAFRSVLSNATVDEHPELWSGVP